MSTAEERVYRRGQREKTRVPFVYYLNTITPVVSDVRLVWN